MELLDERFDVLFASSKNGIHDRRPERQSLDPLRGPFGADLIAGNSPHLFRIGLEKSKVKAFAKTVAYPLLQVIFLRVREEGRTQEAHQNQKAVPQAQPQDDIAQLEGIVEKLSVVIDSREPRAAHELVSQDFVPNLVDLGNFCEEPMSSYVKAISAKLIRARMASYNVFLLENDRSGISFAQLIGGGEASRPRSCNQH